MNVREFPLILFEEFRQGDHEEVKFTGLSSSGYSLIAPALNDVWLRFDFMGHDRGYSTNSYLRLQANDYDARSDLTYITLLGAGEFDRMGSYQGHPRYEDALWIVHGHSYSRLWGRPGWCQLPNYLPVLVKIVERAEQLDQDPGTEHPIYNFEDRPSPIDLPRPVLVRT